MFKVLLVDDVVEVVVVGDVVEVVPNLHNLQLRSSNKYTVGKVITKYN
jgi:hypothetical protein